MTTEQQKRVLSSYLNVGNAFIKSTGVSMDLGIQFEPINGTLVAVYMPEEKVIVLSANAVQYVATKHEIDKAEFIHSVLAHELGHIIDPKLEKLMRKRDKHTTRMIETAETGRLSALYHLAISYRMYKKLEKNAYKNGLSFIDETTRPAYEALEAMNVDMYTKVYEEAYEGILGAIVQRIGRWFERIEVRFTK